MDHLFVEIEAQISQCTSEPENSQCKSVHISASPFPVPAQEEIPKEFDIDGLFLEEIDYDKWARQIIGIDDIETSLWQRFSPELVANPLYVPEVASKDCESSACYMADSEELPYLDFSDDECQETRAEIDPFDEFDHSIFELEEDEEEEEISHPAPKIVSEHTVGYGVENFNNVIVAMVNMYENLGMIVMMMILVTNILSSDNLREQCLEAFEFHLMPLGDGRASQEKPRWKKRALAAKSFLAGLICLPRGITVGSGAADSVFPASWVKRALLKAPAGSRAGLFYVAASGTKLHNLGEFMLKFITSDGTSASIMFQVANINKPLASVAHLTDLGYCVVFNRHNGKDVSYLLHKETNQFLKMKREKGVFVIDAYLHDIIAPEAESEKIPLLDFRRQG